MGISNLRDLLTSRVYYAELVEEMRACVCDMVDVEAGVDCDSCGIDGVELIASIVFIGERIWQNGEGTRRWWECQVCVKVGSIVAKIVAFVDGCRERFV